VTFNAEKFGRAVHYVIWKAANRPKFGAVKLNKVLWFAEARVYVLHRHHMTGEAFLKEQYGPVPKHIIPTRERLKKAGLIEIWEDRGQTRFRAKTQPDMTGFTPEELKQLNFWIDEIDKEYTAASISDKTHDYGWEIAEMGEEIPLYAILAERARHPKGQELEWARKAAERLGLP
jgi:hypothetical protein